MPTVLCVGHAVQDFVFYVPALPDRGEKYRATRFESVGGGPAATAAVAIARHGGRAVLAASIEVVAGRVRRLTSVLNPDKLHHVDDLIDLA